MALRKWYFNWSISRCYIILMWRLANSYQMYTFAVGNRNSSFWFGHDDVSCYLLVTGSQLLGVIAAAHTKLQDNIIWKPALFELSSNIYMKWYPNNKIEDRKKIFARSRGTGQNSLTPTCTPKWSIPHGAKKWDVYKNNGDDNKWLKMNIPTLA